MLASGGLDNLVLWSLQDNISIFKHYQRPSIGGQAMGMKFGATGGAPFGNKNAVVSEVNWSHDGMLLAAAITDYVVIFDIRKLA